MLRVKTCDQLNVDFDCNVKYLQEYIKHHKVRISSITNKPNWEFYSWCITIRFTNTYNKLQTVTYIYRKRKMFNEFIQAK